MHEKMFCFNQMNVRQMWEFYKNSCGMGFNESYSYSLCQLFNDDSSELVLST